MSTEQGEEISGNVGSQSVEPSCKECMRLRGTLDALISEPTSREPMAGENSPTVETSKNGFVYVLRGGGFYKIGGTTDPMTRVVSLAILLPFKIEQLFLIDTQDWRALEKWLHEKFASKRRNGEWFELDAEDLIFFESDMLECPMPSFTAISQADRERKIREDYAAIKGVNASSLTLEQIVSISGICHNLRKGQVSYGDVLDSKMIREEIEEKSRG